MRPEARVDPVIGAEPEPEVGATRTIDAAAAGMSPEQFHAFIDDWYENGMGIEGFELAETPHKPSAGSRMYDRAVVKRVS